MKLAGYDFEGPFYDPSEIKELPGVYVVLNLGVLDVGEGGYNYQRGGQCINKRLQNHDRKKQWELVMGRSTPSTGKRLYLHVIWHLLRILFRLNAGNMAYLIRVIRKKFVLDFIRLEIKR